MSKSVIKICLDCNKEFFARSTYYFHRKLYHKKEETVTKHYKTCDCGKKFRTKSSYYHHYKTCNIGKSGSKLQQNFSCQEENCCFNCSLHSEFLNHLKEAHEIESSWLEKSFQNYAEFEEWKEEFEKFTKTSFKCQCTRQNSTAKLIYFECNRSGSYVSKSTGKRAPKSKGSLKIGFKCPANMKVLIDKKTLTVNSIACCLHYKHEHDRAQKLKKDRISGATQLSAETKHSGNHQRIDSNSASILRLRTVKTCQETSEQERVINNRTAQIDLQPEILSPIIRLKTCHDTSEQSRADKNRTTQNDLQSEIPSPDIRDLECLIEKSIPVYENQLSNPLPSNEDSNFTSLKSNLISKTMAMCDSIKNCDRKEVLLCDRAFIDRAFSVLKRSTETRKPFIIKRMTSILNTETAKKPCILIAKQKKKNENILCLEPLSEKVVNLEVKILNDPFKHPDPADHSYTFLSSIPEVDSEEH